MKDSKILKANSNGALDRLKAKWRQLPEETRACWQELMASPLAPAEIRKQLQEQLQVHLRFDRQLALFRLWTEQQDQRGVEAELMVDDEVRLVAEFGTKWTLDQIREEVLKRAYARSLASGNFALGLATLKHDLSVLKNIQDERKLELLEQKAAAFQEAQDVATSTLSPEEKDAEFRRIFGLAATAS